MSRPAYNRFALTGHTTHACFLTFPEIYTDCAAHDDQHCHPSSIDESSFWATTTTWRQPRSYRFDIPSGNRRSRFFSAFAPVRVKFAILSPSSTYIVDESDSSQSQAYGQDGDIDAETATVQRLIVCAEDLSTVYPGGVCAHDHPEHKLGHRKTYIAMARARSSESLAVKDIQAILSGCEKVPNTWVHTTPKYRTFRSVKAVKARLNTYPTRWQVRPEMTVGPRTLLLVSSKATRGSLQMIRDIAECKGHRNLDEKADGSESIGLERSKAERTDDRGRVGIESSLRTVITKGDEEVDP